MDFELCLGKNTIPALSGTGGGGLGWGAIVAGVQDALQRNLVTGSSDFCVTHQWDGTTYEPIEPVLKPYHIVGLDGKVLATTLPERFAGHYLLIEIRDMLINVFYALRREEE